MGMKDPVPTFSYFVSEVKRRHPNLLYLHIIEPRIAGVDDVASSGSQESNDFIRETWGQKPLISAGGYTRDTAIRTAERGNELTAMGRYYISNVWSFPSLYKL
jgi:NADPH2 dehydrogenase